MLYIKSLNDTMLKRLPLPMTFGGSQEYGCDAVRVFEAAPAVKPATYTHTCRYYFKLKGTHRVQTHAVLLLTLTLTLTCDFETPKTCHF